MYKYSDQQHPFPDFKLPFASNLSADNQWVKLEKLIPWEIIEKKYAKCFKKSTNGPSCISARIAFGSLFIKEKEGYTDRKTVQMIQENPYMQYFLGYKEFLTEKPFDSSMMTHFRKRLQVDDIQQTMEEMIAKYQKKDSQTDDSKPKGKSGGSSSEGDIKNKGKLIMDATCFPSDIAFPQDVNLLNDSREWLEGIIDVLHKVYPQPEKPRTKRRVARKDFLNFSKKKKKSFKAIRKARMKQLGYVRRDLKIINDYLHDNNEALTHLSEKEKQRLKTIRVVYVQQKEMHEKKTTKVENRIVNLSQPYVRPIVRGKRKSKTEFGVKVSASVIDGFFRMDRYSWDSYNEKEDLIPQVIKYYNRNGYYPESIHVDRIYRTRENRQFCKKNGIRISGPPLGRPPKVKDKEKKKIARQDEIDRIEIESKFGISKRKFSLDKIMSKTQHTSMISIITTFFVINSEKILKDIFLFYYFITKIFCSLGSNAKYKQITI